MLLGVSSLKDSRLETKLEGRRLRNKVRNPLSSLLLMWWAARNLSEALQVSGLHANIQIGSSNTRHTTSV